MIRFVGLVLIILVLAGCSKKDVVKHHYTFQGENKSWKATYVEEGEAVFTEHKGTLDADSWSNYNLEMEYRGQLSDLENVKHIEISYTTGLSSGNMVADYDKGECPKSKTFSLKGGSNSCRSYDKDDVIQAEVNLDGKTESFELKLVNDKEK